MIPEVKTVWQVFSCGPDNVLTQWLNQMESQHRGLCLESHTQSFGEGEWWHSVVVSWLEPNEAVEVGEPELPLE